MSCTLYWSPDSANVVVRTVLEELGVAYQDVLVDRAGGVHSSAAYRAMNPQGLLPVLVVPGQDEPLFETAAILLWLADRHSALLPVAEASRGRALKWLFYLSNTLHADLRVLFYSARYVNGADAIPALRAAMHARVFLVPLPPRLRWPGSPASLLTTPPPTRCSCSTSSRCPGS